LIIRTPLSEVTHTVSVIGSKAEISAPGKVSVLILVRPRLFEAVSESDIGVSPGNSG
jgi:hypothetical protein